MKENDQIIYDKRPKRRKDKYNPYSLSSTGCDSNTPHYYISFIDVNNETIKAEVKKDIFDAFEKFELEDLSYSNEVANHYEQSDLTESTLIRRSIFNHKSLEDEIVDGLAIEKLHEAIASLTEKQKRRVNMYFFEGMGYQEIALKEGCKHQSVSDSITQALKKIKKFLENT